jgi:hypothetical protein
MTREDEDARAELHERVIAVCVTGIAVCVLLAFVVQCARGQLSGVTMAAESSPAASEASASRSIVAPATSSTFARAVAVVAAHEGALANLRETALVYQATLAHGSTDALRLRWLKRHSPRALGLAPCGGGNCRWTPNLRDDDAAPAGLDMPTGWWERARAQQWRLIRQYAQRLVSGAETSLPCREQPTTWGGAVDHLRALREGMKSARCVGTTNEGWIDR